MRSADFTFYTKPEYYDDLCTRLANTGTGDRIALATMGFEPDEPGVRQVLGALGAATERGAVASLAVDAYNFISHRKRRPGPLFFHADMPERLHGVFRRKLAAIETLRAHGVRCAITNQPGQRFTSPVSGRSHIKFAIINERLYVGGCNLNTATDIDLMVGWNDPKTANWLFGFAEAIDNHEGTSFMHGKDRSLDIDAQTELLIDAGQRGQSIIFDQALQFIDQAQKELLLTCQFLPNDATMHHLMQAHERGTAVQVVYNHASKHEKPYNLAHHLVELRERNRTPAALFAHRLAKHHQYLHAKLLATEQGVIIGSHNYVPAGVSFGTAEIALVCHDAEFARSALAALERALATTTLTS